MTDPVLSTLDDGVRTITLNRPESLNAMNEALVRATRDAFAEANADPATKAIIFTGAGRAFCAGDDLVAHDFGIDEARNRRMVDVLQQVTREIVLGPKVVVGAINGWAVGGGFEWAIDCDLPLWAESARAFFPETYWGAFVTGGVTALLPRIVGPARARELILFGDKHDANALHEMGIAWRVVPDDALMEEAMTVARRITALPERAVADVKRTLARVTLAEMETALHLETEAAVRAFADAETHERIKAFSAQ